MATFPAEAIQALERAAFAAWPAEEVSDLDGWRLRFMHGVTRRANSAWTAETLGTLALDDRIRRVEAFYAERAVRCCFQLSPLSPATLDAELAARGYGLEAPVAILTARAPAFDSERPAYAARVESAPVESWFALSGSGGRFAGAEDVYRRLLLRLGDRALFAVIELDGASAGVGLGVLEGERCGLFSMLTAPGVRRRGVGRAVVVALARAARERDAATLYLQVERANTGARALYDRLGFIERYGYHYRVWPSQSASEPMQGGAGSDSTVTARF